MKISEFYAVKRFFNTIRITNIFENLEKGDSSEIQTHIHALNILNTITAVSRAPLVAQL